ncbi:MAG: hypothetical protein KZQ70_09180 [gamma proteobacterium symbiont of Lucinoma myriamae]|nr:hypothetical protein [gamma proteobacterium symbiont of Lucinoma myriamae]MCU7818928.1 hypothetical protein [gamma proteobacterium symbiont of Lucinoma myriamae]
MKTLKAIIGGLFLGLCLTYLMHISLNYYNQVTEIKDFSYAALRDNIDRYPDDEFFIGQVSSALLSDDEIVGSEYKAIFDRLIEKNGVYTSAKTGAEHSNAKQELIDKIKKF